MFGLFRKKHDPAGLVSDLQPPYAQAAEAISSVDGPFPNIYECGVFVASFATHRIVYSGLPNATELADAFNAAWLNYLVGTYKVDGVPPHRDVVVQALRQHWAGYCDLFRPCLSGSEEEKNSAMVQLAWDLWSNCTGLKRPERFTNLVLASPRVFEVAIRSMRWADDWTGVKQ